MKGIISILALASLAAGCSLPTDDNAQVIAQDELAPSLQRVTTTTTAPLPESQTRNFAYYLLEPMPESEQRVVRQVVFPIPTGTLLDAVEPMDEDGFKETIGADPALINTVNQYDISDITVDDGLATVFLLSLGDTGNTVQLNVAAQLVWTLLGDPQVEGVLFNIDGERALIPTTNADNSTTDQPVTTLDYQLFDPEADDTSTTTSSSSTSTTTTVPPHDTASSDAN